MGNTEQDSGTRFKIDYLKPTGAIGFYYPDWVAVQQVGHGEVNWIIETKGRVWEDTKAKDRAMRWWCNTVAAQIASPWHYLRVNQTDFEKGNWETLSDLVERISV